MGRPENLLLCGPDQLAQMIIDHREKNKKLFDMLGGPVLLDEWIRDLVRLVYHTSLLPNEGRYPKVRLVFTNVSSGHGIGLSSSWRGCRIDSPESLRTLAPVVAGNATALLVNSSVEQGIAAWQIVDFEQFCAGPPATSNRLADLSILPNGVMFLRADGPGDLRAMLHPSPVFHLRGGIIRTLKSYYDVDPFKTLVLGLCTELHATVKDDKRVKYYVPSPTVFADDFADLWAASLRQAIDERHGGAFVILPASDCPHVKIKYKTEGGLYAAFDAILKPNLARIPWAFSSQAPTRLDLRTCARLRPVATKNQGYRLTRSRGIAMVPACPHGPELFT